MSGVATAIAGAAVVGGVVSYMGAQEQASAAGQAADTQAAANRYAADIQYKMWKEQQALQKPWLEAGQRALPRVEAQANAMPAAFSGKVNMLADPGYAFRLAEGQKALERSAAARGGLISGSALKAAQRYGQDFASQEYQNAYNRALTEYNAAVQREQTGYNRLSGLAGIGQQTAQQLGAAGQQYGQSAAGLASATGASYANALLAQGQARASAYGGIGSALGQGVGSYLGYQQNQALINALGKGA